MRVQRRRMGIRAQLTLTVLLAALSDNSGDALRREYRHHDL